MFLGMGPFELIIIVAIILIIFGPKNLPKIGSALGKTVKNVREGMEEDDEPADDARTSTRTWCSPPNAFFPILQRSPPSSRAQGQRQGRLRQPAGRLLLRPHRQPDFF